MAYADLNTVHNPSTGAVIPAAWGDQIRTNQEFFIDPPVVAVYNSATKSLSNNTAAVMPYNNETFDNDGMASPTRDYLEVQTAGRYLLIATVVFSTNATGERNVEFRYGPSAGTQLVGTKVAANTSGSQNTIITAVRAVALAASDQIECWARQRSGGVLSAQLFEFTATFLTR